MKFISHNIQFKHKKKCLHRVFHKKISVKELGILEDQ